MSFKRSTNSGENAFVARNRSRRFEIWIGKGFRSTAALSFRTHDAIAKRHRQHIPSRTNADSLWLIRPVLWAIRVFSNRVDRELTLQRMCPVNLRQKAANRPLTGSRKIRQRDFTHSLWKFPQQRLFVHTLPPCLKQTWSGTFIASALLTDHQKRQSFRTGLKGAT